MTRQAAARTPRAHYRGVLRRAILDAAREAFVRDGYEHVSMRKLAEKLGCSHGNLYLHFKNKEALFDCLVEESFEQFFAGMRSLAASADRKDPVELLRKMGRAYVEFGVANPNVYEFAFVLRRPRQERARKPHATYERLRALVQRCLDDRRFRRVSVDAASQSLWAAGHGITSLLIRRPSFPWVEREELIGRVIDASVDALLA